MATRDAALQAVKTLIEYIGENPDQPDFRETPERVVRAWDEDWGRGYRSNGNNLVKLFDIGESDIGYSGMVTCTDINFWSTCAHHLVPFHGKAAISYIPSEESGSIVGLSKLARIVTHFACRLQTQEKMTMEIADFIEEHISPNVGVVLAARHLCMESRGVHQPNVMTTTSELRGYFFEKRATRNEFLQLIQSRR